MAKIQKFLGGIYLAALVIIFCLPSLKSGLPYPQGIGFWGPNGHDGIWHLALINHITNSFKIDLPIFAGETLRNYHPFFDFLAAFVSSVFHINSSLVLFQILPLIISAGIILFSYLIARRLFSSRLSWFLLPTFLVISNSFGWVVTFVRSHTLWGESLFWSMQSPSIFFNPPFALSLLFILILIYLILRQPSVPIYLISFILLTLLPVTKAYSAPFGFIIYGIYALFQLLSKKYLPALITFVSLVAAIVLYSVYNPLNNGILQWQPFWFITSMLDSPDRLYLPRISSALNTFSQSHQYFKASLIYLAAIPLFFVGNFATRILGLARLSLKHHLHWYLLPACVFASLVPLFFIQKGTSWNTVQFLYYPLFFASFFLVNFIDNLKASKIKYALIAVLIIVNLIPSTVTYSQYVAPTGPTYIYPQEQEALTFLSQQSSGTVLTFPYDPYAKRAFSGQYLPIWAYETTSYVAAYSRQNVYMADEMNLGNSGYDWQSRRLSSEKFFKQTDKFADRGFLVNNQIDYIYLTGNQPKLVNLDTQNLYLSKIFDNQAAVIYKVQR